MVDLPYENSFDEKQIPTKARPIQMNMELEQQNEEEYFNVMQQLLASRSEPSIASTSDHESEEPFISLGNDNED